MLMSRLAGLRSLVLVTVLCTAVACTGECEEHEDETVLIQKFIQSHGADKHATRPNFPAPFEDDEEEKAPEGEAKHDDKQEETPPSSSSKSESLNDESTEESAEESLAVLDDGSEDNVDSQETAEDLVMQAQKLGLMPPNEDAGRKEGKGMDALMPPMHKAMKLFHKVMGAPQLQHLVSHASPKVQAAIAAVKKEPSAVMMYAFDKDVSDFFARSIGLNQVMAYAGLLMKDDKLAQLAQSPQIQRLLADLAMDPMGGVMKNMAIPNPAVNELMEEAVNQLVRLPSFGDALNEGPTFNITDAKAKTQALIDAVKKDPKLKKMIEDSPKLQKVLQEVTTDPTQALKFLSDKEVLDFIKAVFSSDVLMKMGSDVASILGMDPKDMKAAVSAMVPGMSGDSPMARANATNKEQKWDKDGEDLKKAREEYEAKKKDKSAAALRCGSVFTMFIGLAVAAVGFV